ncbi:uncharacterized protein isoform X1 [Rhodnius prolixus]|uniref:uncharacterized protein isoform X1 n=1 Tax=Rhodnius prolixus TaxID=13249 RepID=UPI003D18E9FA
MAFYDNITKEDTDVAYKTIKKEYGFATVLCGTYAIFKPGIYTILSIIQISIFFIVLILNTIALAITVYLSLNDQTVATQTVHFIFMNAITFTILFSSNYTRPSLSRFHDDIGRDIQPYDHDTMKTVDNLKIYMKKLQKVIYITVPLLIGVFGMLIVSLGPISDYFTGDFGKKIYNENGVSVNLALPCWTPFGSNSTISFLISGTLQILDHYIIVTDIVTANLIMTVMVRHVLIEIHLLISALNRLPERAAIMYQKIYGKKCNGKITEYHENPSLQHCYNECIKQNIKHHIRIIRLINDMNTFWNYTLMIFFFVSTISMAFSGILIMFGDGKITTLVNALVMGFTEIFDVFYICWCGKSISDASELLYMALYDTKWINANKESAKFILIMMAMTKNPYEIYFNSINKLPANFETFANLINTAYSYFNLLYAFREDKAN